MTPWYKEDDAWFFDLPDGKHGPYSNEEQAKIDYYWWINYFKINCPECE